MHTEGLSACPGTLLCATSMHFWDLNTIESSSPSALAVRLSNVLRRRFIRLVYGVAVTETFDYLN